jgi:hypothetical protein
MFLSFVWANLFYDILILLYYLSIINETITESIKAIFLIVFANRN